VVLRHEAEAHVVVIAGVATQSERTRPAREKRARI
jgi:hypothetical protein